ncbi:Npun_F0813 family protein [cf. Phormidesmis sp. LEGE 11477]|uniref:Npun_F0813 family protein n=1 Tax=cf. Phormidesmis sp. LEGE 11477 TaxID=1828680 RepID=UPI00187F54C1|nr:Npun_F0813 family protein [cf. Phormidesmis sp. LEGE 11477]MBE9063966.1 hypothetical protein [cf. Phormidesmis sp. LEGE 11477]
MFVLTPEDVEISSVQHPKRPKRVPILSYQDKTFGLLSVFSAHQQEEAQASWRDLTSNEGHLCVLLEEPHRFSLWRHVQIDQELLNPVLPTAYARSCLLLVQALYGDVEQLLGSKQAKAFGAAFLQNASVPIQKAGGLGGLLRLNPLIEELPDWGEEELCTLLLELHRLGTEFFGRSHFAPRTLSALDILPGDEKTIFLNWLQQSLLGKLWLSA